MMAGFHEILMPAKIALGAVGGPAFNTTVYPLSGGAEYRNQNWSKSLYRWTLTNWMKTPDDIAAMIAFFQGRGGKANGFRFLDLTDFQVSTYQQFATGNGSATQFPLYKAYTDAIGTYQRLIKKPVNNSTISMKVGASVLVEGAGAGKFTVNYTTGVVTFGTAPANLATISWLGQFHVPVRFDTDQLDINYILATAGSVDGLQIVELRNP